VRDIGLLEEHMKHRKEGEGRWKMEDGRPEGERQIS
jgi:hypothetical protein